MKILAIERELLDVAPDTFKRFAEQEARQVWELYQADLIRELYFRADQPTAILVLECASVEEARSILAGLPFVRQGLITFDLIPLIAYPGFARLFKSAV
jgi:hypothetical protein